MGKETNMETLSGFCGGWLIIMIILGIGMYFSMGDVSALAWAIISIIILAFILMIGNSEKGGKKKAFKISDLKKTDDESLRRSGMKICPNCDAGMRGHLKKCPYCGYKFTEKKSTKESSANPIKENKRKQISKKKFCPKCGKELDSNRGRCPYCNHFFAAKRS